MQKTNLTGNTLSWPIWQSWDWSWHSSAPACLYYYDYTLGYIYILPYSFKRICLPGSNKHCLERSILSQKKWFSIMEYSSVTLDWFCRKKLLLVVEFCNDFFFIFNNFWRLDTKIYVIVLNFPSPFCVTFQGGFF